MELYVTASLGHLELLLPQPPRHETSPHVLPVLDLAPPPHLPCPHCPPRPPACPTWIPPLTTAVAKLQSHGSVVVLQPSELGGA